MMSRVACALTTVASLAVLTGQQPRADAPSPQPAVYVGERWVCRPADTGNAPNAVMSSSTQQLRCRPINATLTTSTGRVYVIGKPQADASGAEERISMTSPAYAAGATPKDVHDGWVDMMKKGLVVEETGSSGGLVNVGDRWVCRASDTGHPANASLSSAGAAVPLSCRAVNIAMQTSSGQLIVIGRVQAKAKPSVNPKDDTNTQTAPMSAPYSSGLTVAQMNDAWNAYVNRVFDIATSAAGGG
jgi:hypothetical protein